MKKMFCLICFASLFLAIQFSAPARAASEQLYISQFGNSQNSGLDCANAHSVDWFNNAGNWTMSQGVDNKIGPGDKVHLCGVISIPIQIQGSGSTGNIITILFEPGAKMSATHWNQSGSNGDAAIYGNGVSDITVDGGNNGLIECTDNGTNKAYQFHSVGIQFDASSNIEVKNLTVHNIYVRVEGPDSHTVGGCIQFRSNTHDIKIHDNTVSDGNVPIYLQALSATGNENIEIYNNIISKGGVPIEVGIGSSNGTVTNVLVHDNSVTKSLAWSGYPGIHTDCHFYATQSNSEINGLKVYNNTFTGPAGTNSTAHLFLEGLIYSPLVYNNLFIADPVAGPMPLEIKGTQNALVANSTFVGNGSGQGILTADYGALGTGLKVTNNLFYNVQIPINNTGQWTISSDQ